MGSLIRRGKSTSWREVNHYDWRVSEGWWGWHEPRRQQGRARRQGVCLASGAGVPRLCLDPFALLQRGSLGRDLGSGFCARTAVVQRPAPQSAQRGSLPNATLHCRDCANPRSGHNRFDRQRGNHALREHPVGGSRPRRVPTTLP